MTLLQVGDLRSRKWSYWCRPGFCSVCHDFNVWFVFLNIFHIFSSCVLSHVRFFATPWAIPHQAPLSIEFSRQEYWSGLLFPTPGDLPNTGIKLVSPVSPTLAGGFFTTEPYGKLKLDAYIISSIFSHHWASCFYHTCFPPLEYIDWNGIIGSKCDYFKAFKT